MRLLPTRHWLVRAILLLPLLILLLLTRVPVHGANGGLTLMGPCLLLLLLLLLPQLWIARDGSCYRVLHYRMTWTSSTPW